MGLFGKLFEKKTCDICDGEIGLLGNRKLEDGNLCKKCAGKLSRYFDERRHSTVDQIREQLAYREENAIEVEKFHATRIVGKDTKIYLDENTGRFIISSNYDFKTNNPDIIDVKQIQSLDYRIEEYHTEEKREVTGKDGEKKQESYNPPHYVYHYNFKFTLKVASPWFDQIRFDVNNASIEVRTVGAIESGNAYSASNTTQSSGSGWGDLLRGLADAFSDKDPRMENYKYVEALNAANEIKETLLNARERAMGNSCKDQLTTQSVSRTPAAEPEVQQNVRCPYCGEMLTVVTAKLCDNCGARIG